MKKSRSNVPSHPDTAAEVDFSKGVRGKHFARYREGELAVRAVRAKVARARTAARVKKAELEK